MFDNVKWGLKVYVNNKSFQITNSISFLGEVTRNTFFEFEKCVKKFIDAEKKDKKSTILKDIRKILTECRDELCKIKNNYSEIGKINKNLMIIAKGEIDPLISSYNMSKKLVNRRSGFVYEFEVPNEDKVKLDSAVTDNGFCEAMVRCADITNPKDRIIFLAALLKTIRESYKSIDSKIHKLTNRIESLNDKKSPEYTTCIKKMTDLRRSQKIIDNRLKSIMQMFFAIRKQMIKDALLVSEPFISLFPDGNEDMRELSLKHSIKRDLEDLLYIETLLNKSDKGFKVSPHC